MSITSGGYDISRFVGLDQSLAKHLTCSICLDILKSPVETKCRHTFCDQCIKRWLQTHNECPVCKTFVPNRHLGVNTMAKNIINDLKFRCYTDNNGCQEAIEIQFLASHLEECQQYLCEKCGLRMGRADEHNCLEAFKHELQIRDTENVSLKSQVLDLKRKVSDCHQKYQQLESEAKRHKWLDSVAAATSSSSSSTPMVTAYVRRDIDFETIDCYELFDENPFQLVPQCDDTFKEFYLRDVSTGATMRCVPDIKVRIRLDSKFHTLLPVLRQNIGYRNGKITFYDTMGHIISLSNTPRNTCHRLKNSTITYVVSYNIY